MFDTPYTSLADWDECLEDEVHANMHMQFAGQWNCAVEAQAALELPGVDHELLSLMLLNIQARAGPRVHL